MSLFIRKKREEDGHVRPKSKVEKQKTLTLPRPFICVGFVHQMLPWKPFGTQRQLEDLIGALKRFSSRLVSRKCHEVAITVQLDMKSVWVSDCHFVFNQISQ